MDTLNSGNFSNTPHPLEELVIVLKSEDALNAAFARFKDLADRKSEIFDEDLQPLVGDEAVAQVTEHYRLLAMGAHSRAL